MQLKEMFDLEERFESFAICERWPKAVRSMGPMDMIIDQEPAGP
jgi:hypothetical protein